MTLTPEQKASAIRRLSVPYGRVDLICDGYEVTLIVKPEKALRYCVMTYVNGVGKGAWMDSDKPCPEQKYLNKLERYLYSAQKRHEFEAKYGKQVAKQWGMYSKITLYRLHWPSGKAAISHLCRVCESIELKESLE